MPIIIPNNPPPYYTLNAFQFFLGLGILLAGFYVMLEINMYGGILMIIIGGIIGNLARRTPPGWTPQ